MTPEKRDLSRNEPLQTLEINYHEKYITFFANEDPDSVAILTWQQAQEFAKALSKAARLLAVADDPTRCAECGHRPEYHPGGDTCYVESICDCSGFREVKR